tara:strand:- start:695 stop:1468 length:774 start_codon:yes stop_codon:yes gene_type:complete
MDKYFYSDGIEKFGPYSKEELRSQNISRTTKVWCFGMDKWMELSEVPELSNIVNSIPPELQIRNYATEASHKTETTPVKESNNYSSFTKYLTLVIVVIIISIFTYTVFRNQSEVTQYNEIVSNSYDSDEDFDMYVQKFYRDLEFFGIYPKKPALQIIKFAKLDQLDNTTHIHGLSYGSGDDDKIEIYINPSTWKSFNKPMRYFLMYHELAHDVLNLDDLDAKPSNEGKLMYPAISSYESVSMDDFIEISHALFDEEL